MQIESNLFFKKKDDGVDASGFHDEVGKCFTLKAGSKGKLSTNPRVFRTYPELHMMYEKIIVTNENRCSAGDDTHYYIQKDIQCYPIEELDELTIAASLMAGTLMKGENVWKNGDEVSVRKMRASKPPEVINEVESDNKRYEEGTEVIFQMLSKGKEDLVRMLSFGYHLNIMLGGQNEDLFTVPRQIDRGGMVKLGFECVETEAYDLVVPGPEHYTASDKTKKDCFHTGKKKKARADYIANSLDLKNIRASQSSDNMIRPQFDALILMQYNPYLVCGVAPYSKIVHYFRQKGDGGIVLSKVPIESFRYIIPPSEYYEPAEIPSNDHEVLEKFVDDVRGGIFRKLLDKPMTIVDNSLPESEIW